MAVFLRRKGALEKQVEGEEGKLSSAQEEADSLRARADKLRRTRDKASAYIARLKEEVAALEKLEQDSEHADEIVRAEHLCPFGETPAPSPYLSRPLTHPTLPSRASCAASCS